MSEEPKGWKDRHFFSLNLTPPMPDDNPSTLFDLSTNPARYEETPTEPMSEPLPNPEDEANAPTAPSPS